MARIPAEKVGQGICPEIGCGEPVMYRRSAGGMLSHRCDSCDSSGFASPGGDAFRRRMATIKTKVLEPENKPEPEPVPAPKRAANSVFALGDL